MTDLFNSLTGYSRKLSYRNLLVAPHGIRAGIIDRVEREVAAHRAEGAHNGKGRIRLKMNALVDEQVIDALYRASRAGVRIEVVVRGICALRPGAQGISKTSSCARFSAASSSTRGSSISVPSTSSGSAAPT